MATGPRGTYVMSTRTADDQLIHRRAAFRVRALRHGHARFIRNPIDRRECPRG